MTNKQDILQRKLTLSDGLVLALGSGSVYLIAFVHEWGYTSYYKIPMTLISVSLVNIVVAGTALCVIAIGILFFLDVVAPLFPKPIHPTIKKNSIAVGMTGITIAGLIFIYGVSEWRYWLVWVIVYAVFVLVYYGMPLLNFRGKTFIEALELQDEHYDKTAKGIVARSGLPKILDEKILWAMQVIIVCLILAWNSGVSVALKKTEFMILNTNPELIVLAIYSDNIICAPFNDVTKEILPNISIMKVGADSTLQMSPRIIGRLHGAGEMFRSTPTPTIILTPTVSLTNLPTTITKTP